MNVFSLFHFYVISLCFILGFIILNIHSVFENLSVDLFAKTMSILLIIFKILDSIVRVLFEKTAVINVLPLALCNIALLFCSYYLFTKKEWAFNVFYYFSFGAIVAIVQPDFKIYHLNLYVYNFIFIHAIEIIMVIYIIKYMKPTMNAFYFEITIAVFTLIATFDYIFNYIFGTNYLFINDYVIPALRIIKNKNVYTILMITAHYIGLYIIYLLTVKYHKLFECEDYNLLEG